MEYKESKNHCRRVRLAKEIKKAIMVVVEVPTFS